MIDKNRLVELIPQLRRYARFLARDVVQADDLVQDCLVRALGSQSGFDPARSLKSWTFAIMHNLFIDGKRSDQRAGVMEELTDETPVATKPAQESTVDLKDVGQAIDRLNAEQREILLLVAIEGMSYREVATILELPVGTVMSRLYRAREHLRRTVNEVVQIRTSDNIARLR